MHQSANDNTPVSPYANMNFSWGQGEREEATELSKFNHCSYQSLADSIGFDSVVLKQRESDKAVQEKMRATDGHSAVALPALTEK